MFRGPWGSARSARPPFGRRLRRIDRRARPVDRAGAVQACELDLVDARPNARGVPRPQPVRARTTGAAELAREVLPRNAGAQDEHDPGQDEAVGRGGPTPEIVRRVRRKPWFDDRPERIIDERASHITPAAAGMPSPRRRTTTAEVFFRRSKEPAASPRGNRLFS